MNCADAASTPLHALLEDIVSRHRSDDSGDVATYIPELSMADPDWFGACLVTTDGAVYEAGDSRQPFTIQSISKPFTYALALEKAGPGPVRQRAGVEPSGDAFNSISLQAQTGRPLNPMINAGAIAITGLLYQYLERPVETGLLNWFSRFAGRPLTIDEEVYQSESETGHRNRAIAHLLRNFEVVADPVEESVDLYFRQCSILVSCYDLAVMAATLANHGINPVTGEDAMDPEHVDRVLSVMTTCGMYNYAGQWLSDVGVPAKSGVSGGILAVLPGRMGIGAFSPRLDAQGNSVRGIKVCQELSERFRLHLFSSQRTARSVIRHLSTLEHRASSRVRTDGDARRLKSLGPAVTIMELQGDLQFSGMEVIQRRAWQLLSSQRILLLDFSRVDSVDSAAIEGLALLISRLQASARQVVFSGVSQAVAERDRLEVKCRPAASFADLDSALEACEDCLLSEIPVGKNGQPILRPGVSISELQVSQTLDAAEVLYLERLLDRKEYDGGERICRRGEAATHMFFLTRGTVSVRLYEGETAKYQRLAAFVPGNVFGEMAVLDRRPRSADVWTESSVECYSLSVEAFERLGIDRPTMKIKILEYLLRILAIRMRRANDLIGQLTS